MELPSPHCPSGTDSELLNKRPDTYTGRLHGWYEQIISGKCAITTLTALKLDRTFDTSPELWINLQTKYDLYVEYIRHPELAAS